PHHTRPPPQPQHIDTRAPLELRPHSHQLFPIPPEHVHPPTAPPQLHQQIINHGYGHDVSFRPVRTPTALVRRRSTRPLRVPPSRSRSGRPPARTHRPFRSFLLRSSDPGPL